MDHTPRLSLVPHLQVSDDLFAWRGGRVVLLAEREAGAFVLARGWPEQDRLTDIRRWTFDDPRRFAAQVLRLVREATASEPEASLARDSALLWALQSAGTGGPRFDATPGRPQGFAAD